MAKNFDTNKEYFNEQYEDDLIQSGYIVIEAQKGSIGLLQRTLRIDFLRAARIMDDLEELGVVGSENGTKPRQILITEEQYDGIIEEVFPDYEVEDEGDTDYDADSEVIISDIMNKLGSAAATAFGKEIA